MNEKEEKFSEDFIKDVGEILEMCEKYNTDNLTFVMNINGKDLLLNMRFTILDEDHEYNFTYFEPRVKEAE